MQGHLKRVIVSRGGFTIVELLIVVVVIAILAIVTLVAYTGIRERARASAASAAATQAAKQIELYKVKNNDTYPATMAGVQAIAGMDGLMVAAYLVNDSANPTNYCVTVEEDGVSYSMSSVAQGPLEGVCVENLVPNPKLASSASGYSVRNSTGSAGTGARVTSVSGLTGIGVATAYRNTLSVDPTGSWWRVRYCSVPIEEGVQYTFSSNIRASANVPTSIITIWTDPWAENSAGASATSMNWLRQSVTATGAAGATSVCLETGASGSGSAVNGSYIDVTALSLVRGAVVTEYHDGDSPGWFWTGTPNASTSIGPALTQ